MIAALVVGLAGSAGALVRFAVDRSFETLRARRRHSVPPRPPFPGGTLVVNILGSGAIGVLWGLLQSSALDPFWYSVWATGLAGGLTTFSTFSVAAASLWQGGRRGAAVVHVSANLVCGLTAAWLGLHGASLL
ncbi:fluoride efflux transporter FluC [Arthrobacter sp.]|uniref:fluoride efflux transporter FluC n=1 Tax=Arthrobacter sp. TaxID=1667 RepID=UPI002811ACD0|nr:CrcB family protein [Arthrobacter sp.]